ncbi:MAG: carboxypeptidase-like regulatory domain-containing protein [Caldilineaceae bacterium]
MPTRSSTTTSSQRVLLPLAALALAAALTALLLSGLAAPPAARAQVDHAIADALGRVSGIVTDPQGRPVEGMQVDFYSEIHPSFWLPWYVDSVRSVKTDAAGRYTTALAPAVYRVRFSDPNGVYALQYYSGALTGPAAADVVVAGNVTDGISAQLSLGGSITGTVTRTETFGDYSVVAYKEAGGAWQVAQEAILGAANTYALRGLAPGVYHICLAATTGSRDGPLPCYERLGSGAAYAKDVPLAAGEVVANIDIVAGGFLDLATVRGRVTDGQGSPLAGIEVQAASEQMFALTTTTDAAGGYELQMLAPSQVRVVFHNPDGLYIQQWYTMTEDASTATVLMLQPGEVRESIDGALTIGGRITGTITLSGVTPGGSLIVFALPAGSDPRETLGYAGLYDARTGRYTIGGLPPGEYSVCEYSASSAWYNPRCFEKRADGAPPTVTVTAGVTAADVDFLLAAPPAPEGYAITGTVSAENGQPLSGMGVQLFSFVDSTFSYVPPRLAATTTDAGGGFRFDGLGAGRYQLRAVDPSGLHAATVYADPTNGVSDIFLSDVPQPPLDIRMARGGALSGQVRRDDGQPLPYARLRLFPADIVYLQYEWPDTNYAGADGRFRIGGLPAGTYRVCAEGTVPPRYSQKCYGSSPDDGPFSNLGLVQVTAGAETRGVDITLGPASIRHLYLPLLHSSAGAAALTPAAPDMMGRIAGSIYNTNGEPLAGIDVDLYQAQATGGWSGPSYVMRTDGAGNYKFEPLVAGIYRVAFHDPAGIYAHQYYSGMLSFDTATALAINGNFLDGIDGRLEQAGSITGTVLGADLPYSPIGVFAQVNGAWRLAATADYDAQQRTYTAEGLLPGTYRVCWYTVTEPVLATGPCYDRISGGVDFAAGVVVTPGSVTGGIDLTDAGLVDGGSIRGVVRGAGGAPLRGITVHLSTPSGNLYAPSGHAWTEARTTHTDAGGVYQFDDLLPNDYLLEYANPDGPYCAQYFGNTQDIARARVITVGRGEQRTNVDITLALGGMISGTVLLDGSVPPADALITAQRPELGIFSSYAPYTATYDAQTGVYRIGGLLPGGYKVSAEVDYLANYVPLVTFYGGAADWDNATIITLTAGSTLNNIDINLAQHGFEGVLTGTVTGDGGVPLAGMRVELYRPGYDWLTAPRLLYTATGVEGRYRFEGLHEGLYYVRAVDPSGVYSPGYSGNQVFYRLAETVYIGNGAAARPADMQMVRSGTLRGRVYNRAGEPVSGAYVYIMNSVVGNVTITQTLSGVAGSYASGPVPTGRYFVCAILYWSRGSDKGCYGARTNAPEAEVLFSVAPGAVLDGIDVYLGGTPDIVDQIYIPVVATNQY